MTAQPWNFDPTHSSVRFSVRHMVVSKVHGQFKQWSGELRFDEQDLAGSSVKVSIDAASIDTQNEQRDTHLKSADFFDAAGHPTLTFQSKRIEKTGEGEYRIVGDLTIRGTTREVALATEYNGRQKSPWGDERAGFSAKTSIDRREFGLTWNAALEAGGVMVSDKVEIAIEIEAIRAAGQQVA